jgi:hypothetical protein
MGKEVRSVESYFRGENSQVVRRIWSAWFVNRGRDEMYEMVRGFLEHGRVDLDLLLRSILIIHRQK